MTIHRLAASLLLLGASFTSLAEDVRPGLWRIGLTSRVDAAPGWQPEPFELTQCLDEADAANPDKLLMGMGTTGVSGCDFANRNDTAGHLSFDVNCAGTLGLRGHGEVDFSATRLDGTLEARFADAAMGGSQTIMRNQLHAEYLGACNGAGAGALPKLPESLGGTLPIPPAPPAE